jgi:hypothetical protein
MQRNLDAATTDIRRRRSATQEGIDAAVDLVGLAETTAAGCGTPSAADRALTLIAHSDSTP